jgi:hypothetical protein
LTLAPGVIRGSPKPVRRFLDFSLCLERLRRYERQHHHVRIGRHGSRRARCMDERLAANVTHHPSPSSVKPMTIAERDAHRLWTQMDVSKKSANQYPAGDADFRRFTSSNC